MIGFVRASKRSRGPELARAGVVARRLGWPLCSYRDRLDREAAYVVGRSGERLETAAGTVVANPSLWPQRAAAGYSHPLVRALMPEGAGLTVVDATAGLGGDTLHLAALGARVVAVEANAVLACLLAGALRPHRVNAETTAGAQEGWTEGELERTPGETGGERTWAEGEWSEGAEGEARSEAGTMFPWADAAKRIRVVAAEAEAALSGMATGSVDAVLFDPMFATPRRAPPGFSVLRRLALDAPLSPATVEHALRAARRRVVVKAPLGHPPRIDGAADRFRFDVQVASRAFSYWVASPLSGQRSRGG